MEKVKNILEKKVSQTPFIDTHEHLIDESERLSCLEPIIQCDDWTLLLSHYFRFDLISSGMPKEQIAALFSKQINPVDKWELLKNYWPCLKIQPPVRYSGIRLKFFMILIICLKAS